MSDAPIISLADLTVTFAGSDHPALRGIHLDVAPGECVGVMGLNGAGKTTLGLSLNGVIPQLVPAAVSGRARVGGRDPVTTPVREMARTVGLVLDNPEYQLSQVTVAEEVAFGLENLGVDPGAMPARIAAALEAVGLAGLQERSPFTLSGGQQQRLAIASVLVMEPAILVMDEPTSHLDPVATADVFEVVRRLNRERGMTVVIAEHDVETLAAHVDRLLVLTQGRVAFEGPTRPVLGRVGELEELGLRSPAVTEIAHALAPDDADLPVTIEEALVWLEARA